LEDYDYDEGCLFAGSVSMDSDRWRLEDRLVAAVEEAQAELEKALRADNPSDAMRVEASKKLEQAVERLCDLILRDIVPNDLEN
jgi:ribose 1,5-bisphosphokinase PhnN